MTQNDEDRPQLFAPARNNSQILSVYKQNQKKSFKVRVPTRPDQFDKY
jgi:hypothetical protein